ncbi:MAG TPA: tetratricopeptide repeat protein [Desulfobulbus sp.]|nr:tetratricopeptide repeat protein [Desulfobulbus sp.]
MKTYLWRITMKRFVKFVLLPLLLVTTLPVSGHAELVPGKVAPDFSLQDVYGRDHTLSAMKEHSLIVLYFFDTESSSSLEGLLALNSLKKRFADTDLLIWGITTSGKARVSDFIVEHEPAFPVMLDSGEISGLYQAQVVLPTTCILGPGLKIIDYFQGGGQSTEQLLVTLAERELQRDNLDVALAISSDVQEKNPENLKAKTIYGYAALKADKVDEAENVFRDLAETGGEGDVLGSEGLVAVYARKGETKKAMALADKVEKKAPDRGYVNVIKGDILYSQDKKKAAEAEYRKAVEKPEGEPFQKAVAFNQLGRLYAGLENYQQARQLYDQAVDIDPYYIEAMSNKGVAFQKEGNLEQALASYRQAMSVNRNDTFAAILARKAQELIDLQRDTARKKRIDALVKELAQRFHRQQKPFPFFSSDDTWTSRPMVVSFVDFQEKGGLSERDGMSLVLTSRLSDLLSQSGRVRVVERALMEELLSELNLGSSELADPETALKLGRILAARIVSTGSLLFLPDSTLLNLRLIDTETTAISRVLTRKMTPDAGDVEDASAWLNRQILETIIRKYPLRGFVVQVSGGEVMINLGSGQGVVPGTRFAILEEGEPIKYRGRTLRGAPKRIGELEVVRVEQDLSFARIVDSRRTPARDDKVQELPAELAMKGGKE